MMERSAKGHHRQISKIGTAVANRGEKAWGAIPTTATIDGNAVAIPVGLACGMKPGKTLLLLAGQHCGELNGMEVIRRTFDAVDVRKLRGRLIVLPVANPLQIKWPLNRENPHWLKEVADLFKVNMNRVWPGKRNGNAVERMAYAMSRVFPEVDCLIDFHTWSSQYPAAIVKKGFAAGLRLARHSGIGAVALEEPDSLVGGLKDLQMYASRKLGIPAMTVELPENRVLTEKNIQLGLKVVQNTMRHLKMLPGKPEPNPQQFFITYNKHFHEIRPTAEGLFVPLKDLGELVAKGELLGRIYSMDTFRPVQDLGSPVSGVLFAFSDVDCATNILRRGERAALVYELAITASGRARAPGADARRKTGQAKA